MNINSNHSMLSAQARTKARLSMHTQKQRDSFRLSRRQTIQGALEGILGESISDDWSVDGESFCSRQSATSQQSAPVTSAKARLHGRRCSITKFSLEQPSAGSASTIPKSVEARNNLGRSEHSDDEISVCSQLSDTSRRSENTKKRYARRGSVTKYSLEPDNLSPSQQEALETSSVTSGASNSSFPEIPAQCSTIDSLPVPMKKRKSKKSRDSISKYSKDSMKGDILAASMHKKEAGKETKRRSSKLEKKTTKTSLSNGPESPDSSKLTLKKKKKKELKLRKEKQPESSETASVSTAKSTSSEKRKQKRRCSVTKYNLPQEVENQMDSSFSGPIPVADAPPLSPSPIEQATQDEAPGTPTKSSPPRRHRRRTSVTAYTPGIMNAAEKSPGALSKRPSISSKQTNITKTENTKSPGRHGRRNSITKYSLEKSKPTMPAAA